MAWRAAFYALVMLPLLRLRFEVPAKACSAAPAERTRDPEVSQEPKCTAPLQASRTQPFEEERFPSEVGTQLRYKCEKDYKRQAGSSNLIVCEKHEKTARWTEAKVVCIRDPSLPTQPATSPMPTSVIEMEEKLSSDTHFTPNSYPDAPWEKRREILGVGVSAAVGVVIMISIIVICIIWKRRSQQQAPGSEQEHTSLPMLSLPTTSPTVQESSSFLSEHKRE